VCHRGVHGEAHIAFATCQSFDARFFDRSSCPTCSVASQCMPPGARLRGPKDLRLAQEDALAAAPPAKAAGESARLRAPDRLPSGGSSSLSSSPKSVHHEGAKPPERTGSPAEEMSRRAAPLGKPP